jgi:hypothetical protein
MFDYHKIETKRQDNGLWGTPLYLTNINGIMSVEEKDQELLSAILISIAESKPTYFSVTIIDKFLYIAINSCTNVNVYKFSNFGLIDDILYFFSTEEDKKVFDRILRLKKIVPLIKKNLDK